MKAQRIRVTTDVDAAKEASRLIAAHITAKRGALVTLAAGFTPLAAYQELVAMQSRGQVDLTSARYVGLDEWVGLGENDKGSCIFTMNGAFYQPAGIPKENIRVFDGTAKDVCAEAQALNAYMEASEGLSLAVLGIGINGHVGFNEPGNPLRGQFSLTPLSAVTQAVGRKYFSGKVAPKTGATLTLNALMAAKHIVLIATGAHKREIIKTVLAGESSLPAAAFLNHPGAIYIFDAACCP